MTDARFEDASERPLRLAAESVEDLAVISALMQDAAGLARDLAWMRRKRRFALFLTRFRWVAGARADRAGRPYERVRSVALVEHVTGVRAAGVDPRDPDQALSVLQLVFEPSAEPEDPSGVLRVLLAGDGEIAIEVEALEMRLEDVTRPYLAPSGKAPEHPGD
ncbi:MAG: DUF2948 family protein [Pseudomonadota bacterium]|nr:DUF2948 family protein [Pseudomonadota bacterium]